MKNACKMSILKNKCDIRDVKVIDVGKYAVRSFCAVLLFILAVLTVTLRADASDVWPYEEESAGAIYCKVADRGARGEAIRVLFVGNSFTGRNDMPAMFQKIARAGGYKVYVEWIYEGGTSLYKYANYKTEEGALFYEKLREKQWDYVVLQEQSCKPVKYPSNVEWSVNKLVKAVKRTGAEPVLFMTWVHKRGSAFYKASYAKKHRITPARFYKKVSEFYSDLGNANDICVASVGTAFWRCSQYWPRIELYKSDKVHPTKEGSYLAACVFYTAIFKEKLPSENLSISSRMAATLRRIAYRTTFT